MSIYDPAGMPEIQPLLEAWSRGTGRGKLRAFVAVCPARSHALVEVFHVEGTMVALSTRYLHRPIDEPLHQEFTVAGHDIVVDSNIGPKTVTTNAAAVLDEAPKVWWVRCCMVVAVETSWIVEQVETDTKRAVVPREMVMREIAL